MGWYVYMLLCGDNTLYTGMTDNVKRRLAVHRSGKGARYTRGRGPLQLVYVEETEDKSAALKRERAIKKLTRAEKDALRKDWSPAPEPETADRPEPEEQQSADEVETAGASTDGE